MSRVTPLEYQGPPKEYKPPLADPSAPSAALKPAVQTQAGYYDLDYLKRQLESLIVRSSEIYTACENILQKFALTIDQTDTELLAAQKIAYPGTSIPNIITFQQYKYHITNNNNNAAQYVISYYEDAVSGSAGTNALDISKISLVISSEAKRIKEFIDGYVGDLNDSAEHRTIELFQTWTEDAAHIIERFWEALQGKVAGELPGSELGQLTPEKAHQFQALFQIKLNVANKNITDYYGQLIKNWEQTSNLFYSRNLGPGLKFQLGIRKGLNNLTDASNMPVLSQEIKSTFSTLNDNYATVLTDQYKRNKFFEDITARIMIMISQRDTYKNYMQQLSSIGKDLPIKFTSASGVDEHTDITNANHPLEIIDRSKDLNDNFDHPHNELTGIENLDAHPQYLSRSGGIDSPIIGDIIVNEGIRIDGVDLDLHHHTGSDGSLQVHSKDIIWDSDGDLSPFIPHNLKLVSKTTTVVPPGLTKISTRISFEVNEEGIVSYEIELAKLPN